MSKKQLPDIVKLYEENPNGFYETEDYFDIIDFYESALEPEKALGVVEEALESYPEDFNLRTECLHLLLETGKLQDARTGINSMLKEWHFTNAVERLEINVLQTRLHIETMESDALDADINNLPDWVKYVPREKAVDSIIDIVSALYSIFLYTYAVKVLDKGIELFPDEMTFYDSLIDCLVKAGRSFKEAIQIAERAIDQDPYNTDMWFKLGYLHCCDNNIPEALKAYDYATSINDKFYDAWHALGECHFRLDNYEEALKCYLKGVDKQNDNIQLLVNIGDMCNNCEKYAKARSYYRRALDIDSSKDDALFGMGMSYFLDIKKDNSNFEMAIFWAKKAIAECDTNHLYWNLLGDCYYATDNLIHCINAYQHSINIQPDQADILFKLGQVYYMIDDQDVAIKFLNRAKHMDNSMSSVYALLAASYFELKDLTQSKYYLMQAMETDPTVVDELIHLHPDAADMVNEVKKLI